MALECVAELSEFLRGRRARLKPSDVGCVDHGRYRRVPGLRREELAQLVGVSVAYYTRLEQGCVIRSAMAGVGILGHCSLARDLGLEGVGHPSTPGPVVLRWPVWVQRGPHCVPGRPRLPWDLLDGHVLCRCSRRIPAPSFAFCTLLY
ncbi:hypothetical protein SRB17_87900 [Streptomyces sp. RB17]|nr:hypothetical protein [Streptomyces sp. RB17]